MKQISQQEIQQIINELAEAPAKYVFNTIYRLQNLPEVKEPEEKKEETK